MRKLSADQVFTATGELLSQAVVVLTDEGKIVEVLPSREGVAEVEVFEGILTPGFINAHCHLELSYLKGQIAEGGGLHAFIQAIEAVRGNFSDDLRQQAIASAEEEMFDNGIVAVGDIVNGATTFARKRGSSLHYHNFIEVFAFDPNRAEEVFLNGESLYKRCPGSASITAHSPYSGSKKLLEKISKWQQKHRSILSVHSQETQDENLMFTQGRGRVLEQLAQWNDISGWKPTGKNAICWVLENLHGFDRLLLVHNTFTNSDDLKYVNAQCGKSQSKVCFCFCPNANLYIENTLPKVDIFMETGSLITLGTDSYASNWSLSILDEMKTIQKHYPKIQLQTMLSWATRNGAEFFDFDNLGAFDSGKTPGVNLIQNAENGNLQRAVVKKLV